ncbi:MAG TPA: class I SAM-dependent methyltransferase [Longimicrobium sp.]|nr:class I SAM-dependent methyltransferase [Longimicrobium sp.]
MNERDAIALLRAAVSDAEGQMWADLGAGTGLFTRALAAMVGAAGHVHAADAEAVALRVLCSWIASAGAANVSVTQGDVSRPLALPPLDGVLMANVLHFIPDQPAVLSLAASYLRPGGQLVLIEYEGRRPGRWVPYPVSIARFRELAPAAGLAAPEVVAMRPSAFGGDLYVARAARTG